MTALKSVCEFKRIVDCGVKIASIFVAYLNSISQRVVPSFGKFTSEPTVLIINELVGQFDLLW